MKDLFDSLVRTYVPWLAGVVIGWLVSLGIPLDPEVEVQVTLALMGAASLLWYFLARIFEIYVSPKLGWLLGLAKQPIYDQASSEHAVLAPRVNASEIRAENIQPGVLAVEQLDSATGDSIDLTPNRSITARHDAEDDRA